MKRILIPLLVLMLLCVCLIAPAEEGEGITLEVNETKLPVYAADDPLLSGLTAEAAENAEEKPDLLPVMLLPVKKTFQIQVTVLPKTVKNKKVTLSVENEELAKVKGNSVAGLQAGETVLTISSQENPAVIKQYRLIVVDAVTRVNVTAPDKSVAVGETMTLSTTYIPENATLQKVIWSSANEQIATVDENGTVTGLKRGNVRIVASAADGSNTRANINVRVTQSAEEITLDKPEVTVDAGKTAVLKATVLPKDTDDKAVVWSSSDESIAIVNAQGRVTGVALGECEIICASKATGNVQTKAVVHVQQPVTSITFGDAPVVYAGETGQLTWTIEPANASNPVIALTSGNERILKVSDDGTITGVSAGETVVNAVTTDGSNRRARIKVKVCQHVTGVHMHRNTAYIDIGATNTTRADLEPSNASNHNMTWESDDTSIVTVKPVEKESFRVQLTGLQAGETYIRGTTEDGGFQTSLLVKVGNWEKSLKFTDCYINGKGQIRVKVRNVSELNITRVTLEIQGFDWEGHPAAINTKNGSNKVRATYNRQLVPGKESPADQWKLYDYDSDYVLGSIVVRIVEFEIDHDWSKEIRKNHQPETSYVV